MKKSAKKIKRDTRFVFSRAAKVQRELNIVRQQLVILKDKIAKLKRVQG